jgi:DNA polymerase alpha subunit A
VNVGDHIPYIICTQASAKTDSNSPADRAFHPDDVLRSDGVLLVDYEWYKTQQLHPPVSRLIDPIEGTSSAMIAEHLGLDAKRFRGSSGNDNYDDDNMFDYLSARLDDSEKFKVRPPCRIACTM